MNVGLSDTVFRSPRAGNDITESARWIWLDHANFYGIFWPEEKTAVHGIEQLLSMPQSDLGCNILAVRQSVPLGVMCFFPFTELPARTLYSLRFLLEHAEDATRAKQQGRQFSAQVPKLNGNGLYLARIAVAHTAQGTGVGSKLLAYLEARAESLNFNRLCLHVRKDNTAALAFYEKNGFALCTTQELGYIGLEKILA